MKFFSVYEYGTGGEGTVFIFGGWRTKRFFYMPGINKMNEYGLKCILFLPDTKLISIGTPYQTILDAMDFANTAVLQYLEKYEDKKLVISMGVSFGTIFALQLAKDNLRVDKVMLSAPFGDLEHHVHQWENQRYFKEVLKSQPTSIEDSIKVLQKIDPLKDIEKLRGRPVFIQHATGDKIIHTAGTKKLVDAMTDSGIDINLRAVRGGHYGGIFKNYVWTMKTQRTVFQRQNHDDIE